MHYPTHFADGNIVVGVPIWLSLDFRRCHTYCFTCQGGRSKSEQERAADGLEVNTEGCWHWASRGQSQDSCSLAASTAGATTTGLLGRPACVLPVHLSDLAPAGSP